MKCHDQCNLHEDGFIWVLQFQRDRRPSPCGKEHGPGAAAESSHPDPQEGRRRECNGCGRKLLKPQSSPLGHTFSSKAILPNPSPALPVGTECANIRASGWVGRWGKHDRVIWYVKITCVHTFPIFILLRFIYVHLYLYEHMPQCVGTVRDQTRAVNLLELELQVVEDCRT